MMTLETLDKNLCPSDKKPCVGSACVKFFAMESVYWSGIETAVLAEAERQRNAISNPIIRFFSNLETEFWWQNREAYEAVRRNPAEHGVVKTFYCGLGER